MIGYLFLSLASTNVLSSKSTERVAISLSEQSTSGERISPAELAAMTMIWCGRYDRHIDLCGTDAGLLDSVSILSV